LILMIVLCTVPTIFHSHLSCRLECACRPRLCTTAYQRKAHPNSRLPSRRRRCKCWPSGHRKSCIPPVAYPLSLPGKPTGAVAEQPFPWYLLWAAWVYPEAGPTGGYQTTRVPCNIFFNAIEGTSKQFAQIMGKCL